MIEKRPPLMDSLTDLVQIQLEKIIFSKYLLFFTFKQVQVSAHLSPKSSIELQNNLDNKFLQWRFPKHSEEGKVTCGIAFIILPLQLKNLQYIISLKELIEFYIFKPQVDHQLSFARKSVIQRRLLHPRCSSLRYYVQFVRRYFVIPKDMFWTLL